MQEAQQEQSFIRSQSSRTMRAGQQTPGRNDRTSSKKRLSWVRRNLRERISESSQLRGSQQTRGVTPEMMRNRQGREVVVRMMLVGRTQTAACRVQRTATDDSGNKFK